MAPDDTHEPPQDPAQRRLAYDPDAGFINDLNALERETEDSHIVVGDVEHILAGKGFATLILILALPFVQPIPTPGLSVPFGVAIILLGLRLTVGSSAGLPAFVRRREINSELVKKLIVAARAVFARVERLFRRRLLRLLLPPFRNVAGVSIMLCGLAMCLPLPPVVLFSNSLPAIGAILICLGIIERDGLFVLVGHMFAIATWIYFGFWWEAVKYAWSQLF